MEFVNGDVTQPVGEGTRIIAHVCNDARRWDSAVCRAISSHWPEPEQSFYKQSNLLGTIKVVNVDDNLLVANLFAQRGPDPGELPLETFEICLKTLAHFANMYDASVHFARSPGILSREWNSIEELVAQVFAQRPLYIYDLA